MLELRAGSVDSREESAGRTALRTNDGLIVSVQDVEAADRESGGRTPRSVAIALERRFELAEAEGELSYHSCVVQGSDAECVTGWTASGGRRFTRSGAVVALGDRIVWLDVAGPAARIRDVRALAEAIRASVRVVGPLG